MTFINDLKGPFLGKNNWITGMLLDPGQNSLHTPIDSSKFIAGSIIYGVSNVPYYPIRTCV